MLGREGSTSWILLQWEICGPHLKEQGNELIWPEIRINLPFETIILDLSRKGILLQKRKATPLARDVKGG